MDTTLETRREEGDGQQHPEAIGENEPESAGENQVIRA